MMETPVTSSENTSNPKAHPYDTQVLSINPTATQPSKQHVTLDQLNFDNTALKSLPIDPITTNYVRKSVQGACFSRVMPAPIENPKLVSYSQEALDLLDIDPKEASTKQFLDVFAGNAVLKGSEPAAHCYCGHQFGNFAGQLGDGRAMYLGELVNSHNERWEMQLKGAGPTPYSRDADGRAVLRSSIREFLCSEALYHLGIPTTRAGTLITSDSRVTRDIKYSGNPIQERCTVVLRLAPTFIRFGSFQITNGEDPTTGRRGPSEGRTDISQQLLDYTVRTHFSEIWNQHQDPQTRYAEFYREVVLRTARMVAEWQAVGFAHGVLNTDNMSILGLTIDFGPFGFLDNYDPDFICNGSDHEGRYAFKNQPKICEWNLMKLGEAIKAHLPLQVSKPILELYMPEQSKTFFAKMRLKLGLLDADHDSEDVNLIETLLKTMATSCTDYTNTMRVLSRILINSDSSPEVDSEFPDLYASDRKILEYIISQTESASAYARVRKPTVPLERLQMLASVARQNPAILYMVGMSPEALMKEFEKYEEWEQIKSITDEEKSMNDMKLWTEWLVAYRKRVQKIPRDFKENLLTINQRRVTVMNNNNPSFIFRNYIAQNAIASAEEGDFGEVNRLLELFRKPYDEPTEATEKYVGKKPDWASEICVTCSS